MLLLIFCHCNQCGSDPPHMWIFAHSCECMRNSRKGSANWILRHAWPSVSLPFWPWCPRDLGCHPPVWLDPSMVHPFQDVSSPPFFREPIPDHVLSGAPPWLPKLMSSIDNYASVTARATLCYHSFPTCLIFPLDQTFPKAQSVSGMGLGTH